MVWVDGKTQSLSGTFRLLCSSGRFFLESSFDATTALMTGKREWEMIVLSSFSFANFLVHFLFDTIGGLGNRCTCKPVGSIGYVCFLPIFSSFFLSIFS